MTKTKQTVTENVLLSKYHRTLNNGTHVSHYGGVTILWVYCTWDRARAESRAEADGILVDQFTMIPLARRLSAPQRVTLAFIEAGR